MELEAGVWNTRFIECMEQNKLEVFSNSQTAERFCLLADLLLQANQTMNLTAIREEAQVIPLHFADSLVAARYLPQNARVLDVGCGAGFPSLPLAVVRPDITVVSMDSTAKKLEFVKSAALTLGLSNLTVRAGRAEEFAVLPEMREQFDVVCARAVARLNVLEELCVPFLKVGGTFLALKGARGQDEFDEGKRGLAVLGIPSPECLAYALVVSPDGAAEGRTLILGEKKSHTPPQYPRKYAAILKKPL